MGMEGTKQGKSVRGIRLRVKESLKVWRQNGWKGRVQDTDGMLKKKEKEQGEEGEKEVLPEVWICQWRNGKVKSKRKIYECGAEWKEQRHEQARKKGGNQRIKVQQGVWEVYDRENTGVPGEREKWWRDPDVGTKREKTGSTERKEGAECAMRRERQTNTKEWGEIPNEDRREIGWMKEI
jgi:hypothetical protein